VGPAAIYQQTRNQSRFHRRKRRHPERERERGIRAGMAAASLMWVFGYGSLIWNPGFAYDARVVGFVRDYRRVFYQGNTSYPPACRGRAIAGLFVPALSFFSPPFPLAAGQGARTTGARRSSPGGPSRSSTSPERLAYAPLHLCLLLCYCTCYEQPD